jgi:hypothetical protein
VRVRKPDEAGTHDTHIGLDRSRDGVQGVSV